MVPAYNISVEVIVWNDQQDHQIWIHSTFLWDHIRINSFATTLGNAGQNVILFFDHFKEFVVINLELGRWRFSLSLINTEHRGYWLWTLVYRDLDWFNKIIILISIFYTQIGLDVKIGLAFQNSFKILLKEVYRQKIVIWEHSISVDYLTMVVIWTICIWSLLVSIDRWYWYHLDLSI